jgi:hypothetical protein
LREVALLPPLSTRRASSSAPPPFNSLPSETGLSTPFHYFPSSLHRATRLAMATRPAFTTELRRRPLPSRLYPGRVAKLVHVATLLLAGHNISTGAPHPPQISDSPHRLEQCRHCRASPRLGSAHLRASLSFPAGVGGSPIAGEAIGSESPGLPSPSPPRAAESFVNKADVVAVPFQ